MDALGALQLGAAALLAVGGGFAVPGALRASRPLWRRLSRIAAVAGTVLGLIAAALSWRALGRPPAGTAAEMLVLAAPAIGLGYLVIEAFAKSREAGLLVLLAAAGAELVSIPAVNEPFDLPLRMAGPAGPWLIPYLAAAALGYGVLAAAALQAAAFLVLEHFRRVQVERLSRAVYWSACLGFPFLLASLVISCVWSQQVHGSWWDWTARQSWTLVLCLAVLAYLNLRFVGDWPERAAAWILALSLLVGAAAFPHAREMPAPGGDATVLVEPRELPPQRGRGGSPAPRPRSPKPPAFTTD